MSIGVGLSACAVSSAFFGCMFVPLKKYNAADGMFVQWVMSAAILCVGFVVFFLNGCPGFYPLAMLGGVSWTIGNATAIPIISRLGMALGILVWNTTNCLTGWAGGRFGLFGMQAHPPQHATINYLGLVCVCIGGAIFSLVKGGPAEDEKAKVSLHLDDVPSERDALTADGETTERDEPMVIRPKKNPATERMFGIGMALFAGMCYGVTFVPVIYMMDNPQLYPDHPKRGLAYAFSHFCGIFVTATAIFLVYAMFKRNKPTIDNRIVLPSFFCGILWAVGQSSFFIANENLSQSVSFPIITMLPGCIASLWSIFIYKEIRGRKNLLTMAVAMTVTLCGAILVGLSK